MFFIYRHRGDLQSVFLLDTAEGRKQFAAWFEQAGPREYDLPPELSQQHMIQERPGLLRSGKKMMNQAYRIMAVMEPIAIRIAKRLPPGWQRTLKRFWLALKSQIIRGF
jgi:hypothetical protein